MLEVFGAGHQYAITGNANASSPGDINGIHGTATNTNYIARGGYFEASAPSSTAYGIYATASGSTAYAAYFNAGYVRIQTRGSSATNLCIDANNVVSTCSSSLRYKENISNLSMGLETVMQLNPVTFNWKDGQGHDLGFIAEEVASIDPLLATYLDGRIEGVKYSQLTAVLVNAVKEQQNQINNLQSVIGINPSEPVEQLFVDTIFTENITSPDTKDVVIYPGSGRVQLLGDLVVAGNITSDSLTVTSSIATNNLIVMEKLVTQDLSIKGHVLGAHDNRGTITIKAGETEGEFVFDEIYDTKPFILLTPLQQTDPKYWVEFAKDVDGNYLPYDKFYIKLSEPAPIDLEFNWTAQQ
jgi:hypothetical protein